MSVDLPIVVWTGTFNIFGVELVCHVLSDGTRIIEAESMDRFFHSGARSDELGQIKELTEWQRGASPKPIAQTQSATFT